MPAVHFAFISGCFLHTNSVSVKFTCLIFWPEFIDSLIHSLIHSFSLSPLSFVSSPHPLLIFLMFQSPKIFLKIPTSLLQPLDSIPHCYGRNILNCWLNYSSSTTLPKCHRNSVYNAHYSIIFNLLSSLLVLFIMTEVSMSWNICFPRGNSLMLCLPWHI